VESLRGSGSFLQFLWGGEGILRSISTSVAQSLYRLDDLDSILSISRGIFSLPPLLDRLCDATSLAKGTGGSSPGVNSPEREVDHSPPSSAEVMNAWSYTSTPLIRLHSVVIS
jgi:hypothetical protein